MKTILPYLLVLLFCFAACSKKSSGPSPEPAATTPASASGSTSATGTTTNAADTGSLTGVVSPAVAVKAINALFLKNGKTYSVSADTVTGAFTLASLPVGNYRVSFATDPQYNAIAPVNTLVTAKTITGLGTLTTKKADFYLSYEIDGTFEGWFFKGYYSSPYFYIGPLAIGSYPEDMRTAYYPSITLDSLTRPGTYTCKGASKSKITYSGIRLGSGARISYQSTEYAGGEGAVVITSIDTVNRVIKGMFTATLTSATGSSAARVITKGIINAPY